MGALSKGCGTCKRRKVKCDKTHPQCRRCSVAGIECTGFTPSRLRYVHEKPRIQRREARVQKQSSEHATRTGTSHVLFHSSRIRPPQTPVSASTKLSTTLPLTAFQDDIFVSFLVYKFFDTGPPCHLYTTGRPSCGLPREWTQELIKTPQKPRPKSWDALAAIVFGQAYRRYDIVKSALRLYGQALAELRVQLSDPQNRYGQSTLASITALYMYQIIVSKTEKSWLLHIDGLGGILQSRGPWLEKSSAARGIFLEHRIALVAKAIMSGQRTFLSQTVWKSVPWEDDPASKSPMDYLVGILADIAVCLADAKTLHDMKTNQELNWAQLRVKAAICVEDLNTWWRQWEAKNSQAVTSIPSPQALTDQFRPPLLEYDTLKTAYELCFHNVVRILLLQLCTTCHLSSHPNALPHSTIVLSMPNPTVLLGISSDRLGLAREILQSLTYCYAISCRFVYTFSFLFIQEVAYGCFERDADEAKWALKQDWVKLGRGVDDDSRDGNLLGRVLPEGKMRLVGDPI